MHIDTKTPTVHARYLWPRVRVHSSLRGAAHVVSVEVRRHGLGQRKSVGDTLELRRRPPPPAVEEGDDPRCASSASMRSERTC